MVKELPLQNGMVALVDDEDFERCSQYNWVVSSNERTLNQVKATVENKKEIYLNRFILKAENHEVVYYKDGDRLNNKRSNLVKGEVESKEMQEMIRRKQGPRARKSSKYKGVGWKKDVAKWRAFVAHNGKTLNLGCFTEEDDAARAYNDYVLKNLPKGSYLNDIGNECHLNTEQPKNRMKKTQRKRYNKTGYKGVTEAHGGKKLVRIAERSEAYFSKVCNSEEEAAMIYDRKALEIYGDKAILNFPELKGTYLKENENELSRN